MPPFPDLAPGSALGSRPRVARSSAQVPPVYSRPRPSHNSRPGRRLLRVRRAAPRFGRCRLPLPLGPDCLFATGQLVRGCDVADRAVQANLGLDLSQHGERGYIMGAGELLGGLPERSSHYAPVVNHVSEHTVAV